MTVDIGGSHVKVFLDGRADPERFESGPEMSPGGMVARVIDLVRRAGTEYDAVSIGYPGAVSNHRIVREPGNLGDGWIGFDFASAFGKPVRIVNDAALQALGAYEGGRMLFLGLGTGVGSAIVAQYVVCPMELGDLHFGSASLADALGHDARIARGREEWVRDVHATCVVLIRAFAADYIVLGGGHAADVDPLPSSVRRGGNEHAREGGLRLWRERVEGYDEPPASVWRVIGAGGG